jgi:hypothetical protein
MGISTTVSRYKWLFDIWYFAGVSPLSFHKLLKKELPTFNTILSITSSKDKNSAAISNEHQQESRTDENLDDLELYGVESWKKAGFMFWVTTIFFITGFVFSVTRLFYILVGGELSTVARIGSVLWTLYVTSSFLIMVLHILKHSEICHFLWEWQVFEGSFYKGMIIT